MCIGKKQAAFSPTVPPAWVPLQPVTPNGSHRLHTWRALALVDSRAVLSMRTPAMVTRVHCGWGAQESGSPKHFLPISSCLSHPWGGGGTVALHCCVLPDACPVPAASTRCSSRSSPRPITSGTTGHLRATGSECYAGWGSQRVEPVGARPAHPAHPVLFFPCCGTPVTFLPLSRQLLPAPTLPILGLPAIPSNPLVTSVFWDTPLQPCCLV